MRAGNLDNSALKSRRTDQLKRKLVCAKQVSAEQEKPTGPQDLTQWPWIKLDMLPNQRTLMNTNGDKVQVNFHSKVCVNSVEAMTQCCLNGLGLATPPDFLVDRAIEASQLIEILPLWQVQPMPVYALWPGNAAQNSNSKRLLAYLLQSNEQKTQSDNSR